MAEVDTVIDRYFQAWDEHNPSAIVALFNTGGTYSDPSAGVLTGNAIGDYAQVLFKAFPDLKLELISKVKASNNMFAVPWLLFGTHEGQLQDIAPTGRRVVLTGCDFISISNDKLDVVQGIFDINDLLKQLGVDA